MTAPSRPTRVGSTGAPLGERSTTRCLPEPASPGIKVILSFPLEATVSPQRFAAPLHSAGTLAGAKPDVPFATALTASANSRVRM